MTINVQEGIPEVELGERLRQLRTERGISAAELARGVGLSKGMISQLERGLVSPSVHTLEKLAAYLQIPVTSFFEPEKPRVCVVHPRDRKRLVMPESGIHYELLTPGLDWRTELLYARVAPGQQGASSAYSHCGEETIVVLRGSMSVQLGEETYLLSAGDAISFDAGIPHRLYNAGTEKAAFISAVSPPTFS